MPRRSIWSPRQRAALLDLPTDEAARLRHYTLSDDDIAQIRVRRGGHNRLASRSGSGAKEKFTTARARASNTAWPGSTCSQPSSTTGIRPSRRSGQTAKTRRADSRARAPGPHLTPWVGPHPAHRRIPAAKAPIAALAYDSAPYQSRPVLPFVGFIGREARNRTSVFRATSGRSTIELLLGIGGGGGGRTLNLRIQSPALCHLSYPTMWCVDFWLERLASNPHQLDQQSGLLPVVSCSSFSATSLGFSFEVLLGPCRLGDCLGGDGGI